MLTRTKRKKQTTRISPIRNASFITLTAIAMMATTSGCSEARSGRAAVNTNSTVVETSQPASSAGFAMSGVVTEVTAKAITLTGKNLAEYKVLLDAETMVTLDGNEATSGSLQPGQFANVIVDDDSGDNLTARAVDAVSDSE